MVLPAGYVARPGFAFAAGVAVGAASGYSWGHCNWRGGDVDIDVNRNANINANINRSKYQGEYQSRNTKIQNGKGSFQHDASHRQGVAYRDQKTASQFGKASSADAAKGREAYRGRTETGRQELPGGVADRSRDGGAGDRATPRASTADRSSAGSRGQSAPSRDSSAFEGVNRGGGAARNESTRGSASRSAPSRSGGGGGRGGRR